MRPLLVLAGIYNLCWGAVVVFFPNLTFERMGLEPPLYPAIWQCVGMIVGVYGIGYLIASRDPFRHWPIVLVGLLGKVLGPIGFVYASLITDQLPPVFGWVLIPNDLIWWVPFSIILFNAAKHNQLSEDAQHQPTLSVQGAIERATDQYGISVSHRSVQQPVLLVFLRHMGCAFCLQTLQDLAQSLPTLRKQGIEPVVVHMSSDQEARQVMLKYGLEILPRISDPKHSSSPEDGSCNSSVLASGSKASKQHGEVTSYQDSREMDFRCPARSSSRTVAWSTHTVIVQQVSGSTILQ